MQSKDRSTACKILIFVLKSGVLNISWFESKSVSMKTSLLVICLDSMSAKPINRINKLATLFKHNIYRMNDTKKMPSGITGSQIQVKKRIITVDIFRCLFRLVEYYKSVVPQNNTIQL